MTETFRWYRTISAGRRQPSDGDNRHRCASDRVHGDHAYVLNARGGESLYGYRVVDRRLTPIPGSHRALSLETTATTSFTATPGQVTFTPQGSQVPATAKGAMSTVNVFRVQRQLVRRADGPWERCDRRGDSGHSLGC